MELAPGTRIEERYEVRGLLGRGGLAAVYRAADLKLGVDVALKVLAVPTRALRERLALEGRVQAGLRHPNVVAVTDVVTVDGCPGLVLELVEGPNLEALAARHRLDPAEAELVVRGIAAGLGAAHAHGLVHRDLKPANVLLAVLGDALVPKVADFGLVKLLGGDPSGPGTRTGATLGTPRYMAPEQARDAAGVDGRADLWALGAILQELVTGRPAFDGPDPVALLSDVVAGRRAPLPPGLPPALAATVDRCLTVDRAARPATAALVLASLGDPPRAGFRPETLAAARAAAPPVPGPLPPRAATWSDDLAGPPAPPSEVGAPTWDRGPASLAAPPPAGGRRRRVALAGGALAAGALALALGALAWRSREDPFTVTHAGQVDDGPEAQRDADAAWVALLANRDHEARVQADRLLAREPRDPTAWLVAATTSAAESDLGRWSEEIRRGALLAEQRPGDGSADLLRMLDRAQREDPSLGWWEARFEAWLAERPDDLAAWVHWVERTPPAGSPLGARFVDAHPELPLAWFSLGNALQLTADTAEIAAFCDRALASHPDSAPLLSLRAGVHTTLGRLDEALADADRALRLDPGWSAPWTTKAQVALVRRDEEALAEVLRVARSPSLAPARRAELARAVGLALAGAGRVREADALARTLDGADGPVDAQVLAGSLAMALVPSRASEARRAAAVTHLQRALAAPGLGELDRRRLAAALALDRAVSEPGRAGDLDDLGRRVLGYRAAEASPDAPLPEGCSAGVLLDGAERRWIRAGRGEPPTEADRCPGWSPDWFHAASEARRLARVGDAAGAAAALDAFLAQAVDVDPDLPLRGVLARAIAPRALPPAALPAFLAGRRLGVKDPLPLLDGAVRVAGAPTGVDLVLEGEVAPGRARFVGRDARTGAVLGEAATEGTPEEVAAGLPGLAVLALGGP